MTYAQLYDLVLRYEGLYNAVKNFCARHEGDATLPDLYKLSDPASNCAELPGFRERNHDFEEDAISGGRGVRNTMQQRANQNEFRGMRQEREGASEARRQPSRLRRRGISDIINDIPAAVPGQHQYIVSRDTSMLVSRAIHGPPEERTTIDARDTLQRCPEAVPVLVETLHWWGREQEAIQTGRWNGEGQQVLDRMAHLHQIWEHFRATQANHAPNDGFVEVAPTVAPTFRGATITRAVPDAAMERPGERLPVFVPGDHRGGVEQPRADSRPPPYAEFDATAPVPAPPAGTPEPGPGLGATVSGATGPMTAAWNSTIRYHFTGITVVNLGEPPVTQEEAR